MYYRYRLLQSENTELKRVQSTGTAFSELAATNGMDDSQLVQELNYKNQQVEILHGKVKTYADNLDKERRRVAMLTSENQNYQCQLQQLTAPPPLPPRLSNFVSNNQLLSRHVFIILFYFYSLVLKLNQLEIHTNNGKQVAV